MEIFLISKIYFEIFFLELFFQSKISLFKKQNWFIVNVNCGKSHKSISEILFLVLKIERKFVAQFSTPKLITLNFRLRERRSNLTHRIQSRIYTVEYTVYILLGQSHSFIKESPLLD